MNRQDDVLKDEIDRLRAENERLRAKLARIRKQQIEVAGWTLGPAAARVAEEWRVALLDGGDE